MAFVTIVTLLALCYCQSAAQQTLKIDTIWKSSLSDPLAPSSLQAYHDTVVFVTRKPVGEGAVRWFSTSRGQTFDTASLPNWPSSTEYPRVGTDIYGTYGLDSLHAAIWCWRGDEPVTLDTMRYQFQPYSGSALTLQQHPTVRNTYTLVERIPIFHGHAVRCNVKESASDTLTPLAFPFSASYLPDAMSWFFDYSDKHRLYAMWQTHIDSPHNVDGSGLTENYGTSYRGVRWDSLGGIGMWNADWGFTCDSNQVGYFWTDIVLKNVLTSESMHLHFRDSIIRSLMPDLDTTNTKLALRWNWSGSSYNSPFGIAVHAESRNTIALAVKVERLTNTRWTPSYGIAISYDRGSNWSWARVPTTGQDELSSGRMVIDPLSDDLYYPYTLRDSATDVYHTYGIVRVTRTAPLSVLDEHGHLAEQSSVCVYPNPTAGVCTITLSGSAKDGALEADALDADALLTDVSIINAFGDCVARVECMDGKATHRTVDLSHVADGIYYVKFERNGVARLTPVVVQH